jgi:UDP-N-acetylglucosamine--N-acetylmuramyl-(pentapeptide) pyrophosphoryl-undecaprenol N-acetylglucosamine transferase
MKAIIAAGGSGGHITPALAIARELQTRGVEILYVGNRGGMEERMVRAQGFAFRGIDVQKLYRSFTLKHLLFPIKLARSILDARRIMREFTPDFFVGTGGFVSGPVGFAAHQLGIPIFLQEQNSFAGLTNRMLGKSARLVFLGNAGAKRHFKGETRLFGNPINQAIMQDVSMPDLAEYGMNSEAFRIMLVGGSQGSVVLNRTISGILDALHQEGIELFWQIGSYSYATYGPIAAAAPGVYGFDFTHEIAKMYNASDVVIARSGALTLAEIETKGVPAILVPLPSSAENHQLFNAEEQHQKGIAICIQQKDLTPDVLLQTILQMKTDIQKFKTNFSHPTPHQDAAENIATAILTAIKE